MANLFVIPNDQLPAENRTKSTVRHTNFDADGNAFSEVNSRTFSDFNGLGEIEIDASTIAYTTTPSESSPQVFYRIPESAFTDRAIHSHSVITCRAEAGGGASEAIHKAGVVLPVFMISGGVVFMRVTSRAPNLTAPFTGKFFIDSADGIPDNPTTKKETKKATRASYTVLD